MNEELDDERTEADEAPGDARVGSADEEFRRACMEAARRALDEDLRSTGDITSRALFTEDETCAGVFTLKEDGIVAGLPLAQAVFKLLSEEVEFTPRVPEGQAAVAGSVLAMIKGPVIPILEGERTALNFLQRLSGIATLTAQYVRVAGRYGVRIKDTRKTTPGLRLLEKYAVRVGGGLNHRMGLFDAILIKDNHVQAAGGVGNAVRAVRSEVGPDFPVEVEVEDLAGLAEAIEAGADTVMLDNMAVTEMARAVELAADRAKLEASGGINLTTLEEIAATGVDFISAGALTHSCRALDISLDL